MTGKRLNIGLIGSGFMGQAHADAFRRAGMLYKDLPAVPHLYMLADATAELAADAAARFGFETSTGDWRELVNDPNVDVVDITSPNALHHQMALAAIAAGKHVYCEKPLSVTVAEAEEMTAAAKAAGVKTMVAFNNVKTPAAMLAKQIVDAGEIGTPTRFRGWFDQGFFNDPDLPFSWRCTRKEAGSGALGDLGSHVISVAQYLMGDIASTIAQTQTWFPTRPVPQGAAGYSARADADAPRREVENEDQVQSMIRFGSGAGGTIEASRIAAGKVFGVYWEISGTDALDLGSQDRVAPGAIRQPGRIGTLRQVIVVGGRGDRQNPADRLDPVRITMRLNEIHHHFDRRSSSAIAKYAEALRKISFAWRSSRFSRSSAFILSAISLGTPARLPLSTSAFLTQSFNVFAEQPIFAAINVIACQRDPC